MRPSVATEDVRPCSAACGVLRRNRLRWPSWRRSGKGAENVADLEGKSLRAPADEPRVGADNPIPSASESLSAGVEAVSKTSDQVTNEPVRELYQPHLRRGRSIGRCLAKHLTFRYNSDGNGFSSL